jgi:mannose-1-phosphate guanylyltransferase
MKALLLAAGLGTRLRPLTLEIPKCLVPINGKPLLEYWLDMVFDSGIPSAMINLHYLSDKVVEFIEQSPHRSKIEMVFEETLLGTGGTLLKNRAFFDGGPVLLVHADNYSIFNLADFWNAHISRPKHCDITMMTFKTDTPESCGILELDQDNVVTGFHEKVSHPPGNIANGAVYILDPSVIDFLDHLGRQTIDFSTEVLPHYIGKIFTFPNNQYHRDIGTMESYQKAQELL